MDDLDGRLNPCTTKAAHRVCLDRASSSLLCFSARAKSVATKVHELIVVESFDRDSETSKFAFGIPSSLTVYRVILTLYSAILSPVRVTEDIDIGTARARYRANLERTIRSSRHIAQPGVVR